MASDDKAREMTILQPLIFPEIGICTERDLYLRLKGTVGFSGPEGRIEFGTGGEARFNTYFNLFSLGKWQRYCDLSDIRLRLEGEGRFEIVIFQAPPENSFERIVNEIHTLESGTPLELDLSDTQGLSRGGALFFEVRALGPGQLAGAAWVTAQAPVRTPELMLSITTFRREAAVRRSVSRFEEFIATSPYRDHIRLTVVDNGRTAEIKASSRVGSIGNENLGGAGGFTRGLLEAKAKGATHCLFMDDDATIHMQTLERTWLFLAYTTDPTTAVVGALAQGSDKWSLWESGAVFNAKCHPQHMGLDLRDIREVVKMEGESVGFPHNFYGGWWYFAFPVDQVTHLPFPFFVRGDDVSFSLVHDFRMVTLPGIITFQDSDFSDKVTPLTEYLDMRSHMAHHLALPSMDIGRFRTLKIAAWFFARTMSQCHYETLEALNLAIEDVMEGPGFFERNIDMAQRRADIKALTEIETWKPLGRSVPIVTPKPKKDSRLLALSMVATLNGHFIPLFKTFAARRVLPASDRGQLSRIWGAAEITYVDRATSTGYTVTHSKKKAWKQGWRMLGNAWRFWRSYGRLKAEWQAGYTAMTTEDFWHRKLKLEADTSRPDAASPDKGAA